MSGSVVTLCESAVRLCVWKILLEWHASVGLCVLVHVCVRTHAPTNAHVLNRASERDRQTERDFYHAWKKHARAHTHIHTHTFTHTAAELLLSLALHVNEISNLAAGRACSVVIGGDGDGGEEGEWNDVVEAFAVLCLCQAAGMGVSVCLYLHGNKDG